MYIGLIVAAIGLAGALVRTSDTRVWVAAGGLVTSVIIGYILSRTTGLPQSTDDIGNWGQPLGIAMLFVGGSLLALSSGVLLGRRGAGQVRSASQRLSALREREGLRVAACVSTTQMGAWLPLAGTTPYDRRLMRRALTAVALVLTVGAYGACGSSGSQKRSPTAARAVVPPLLDPANVYAADSAGRLSSVVRRDPSLVYVPNSQSNTVDVINPRTFKIIRHFRVKARPQHVVPSYDLKTLYVASDLGNSLRPIDPITGKPGGKPIPVADPYNLYFTPDGRYAITVAELLKRLDFRDPHTMALRFSLRVHTCPGVDHADFSADGRYMYLSCEYLGAMIKIDLQRQRVIRTLDLHPKPASPQDVKLSPNGRLLYVADQDRGGLWKIDPQSFTVIGFLRTGKGAHGLYPSRDARQLYVSNRTAGTISVIDFATRRVVKTWNLGSSSPDMGGVSVDGKTLWLSGRYNAEVYAINTRTGRLRARIKVGQGPHGLCVWPQPGRYSLGHTGILR